ncbi:MAG TPA: hypothetical protein VFS34_11255 [Thermoanaerobaculia bacterium]|nr:hypothetical protein [Thermoanaerobaculia bacterium]
MRGGGLALGALLVSLALPLRAAEIPALVDSGWQTQRRWSAVTANGSFVYDFALNAWNGAGKLKESFTRSVRVSNRGEEHRSEVLSATRDGRDVTAEARAEELKPGRARPKAKDDFPSPFDPRFRDRYAFSEETAANGDPVLTFRPRAPFDGAIEGTAQYDAAGSVRRVHFTLAKRPRFTRRLDFTIEIGADGYPARVESDGEVSLVVWKRRFESTLHLRDVRAGEKEAR